MPSYMCMWELPMDYTYSGRKVKMQMRCTRLPKKMFLGTSEKDYLPTDGVGKYLKIAASNEKEAVAEAKKRLAKYYKKG